jgi:hypothetical protein
MPRVPKQQDQEQQDERSQSEEPPETLGTADGATLETRPERLLIQGYHNEMDFIVPDAALRMRRTASKNHTDAD